MNKGAIVFARTGFTPGIFPVVASAAAKAARKFGAARP